MTWIGNPTMWWRTKRGMRAHILNYGMNPGERDGLKALEEARIYAKEHNIIIYVVCAFGSSIAMGEDTSIDGLQEELYG
jgi:hypothetical protein